MTTTTQLEFLTVKEAAEQSGKSEITIRRLLRSIAEKDDHKDRDALKPNPKELKKLLKSKKPFSYSISAELITNKYAKKAKKSVAASPTTSSDVIDVLRKQSEILERELNAKNSLLEQLAERQREQNILMKDLHTQLQLGSGQEVVDVVEKVKKGWWKKWM